MIERVQYNAGLQLRVQLKEHLDKTYIYNELGLESRRFRRCFRRLRAFYKKNYTIAILFI